MSSHPGPPAAGVPWMASSTKMPSARATSCQPCRRRKVKCEPPSPDGPAYPCSRCVKMGLKCETPRASAEPVDDVEALHQSLLKTMGRGIATEADLQDERASNLLGFFTYLYRRRILTNLTPPDGMSAQHFRGIMAMILERYGRDLNSFLATLTPLTGPDVVVVDGRPLTNQGCRGQQLTPYVSGLFHEGAACGFFTLKGASRFLTNRLFAGHWFTEDEAQELLDREDILAPIILASIICPGERPRFEKSLREMLLEGSAASCEHAQIYKVRLRQLGVTVVALVKLRVQVLAGGEYAAFCIGLSPLPMYASASQKPVPGERRAALHVRDGSDPWRECARVFGDFDDPIPRLGPAVEGTTFAVEEARLPMYRQPPQPPVYLPRAMIDPSCLPTIPNSLLSSSATTPPTVYAPAALDPHVSGAGSTFLDPMQGAGVAEFDQEDLGLLNQLLEDTY